MRLIVALFVLALWGQPSQGAVIGSDSLQQEIYVLNQKISVLYDFIRSQCPTYVVKRSINKPTNQVDITVAKALYHKLAEKYSECKKIPVDTINRDPLVRDCQDYYMLGERDSGVFTIRPENSTFIEFDVWCDFVRGHGWTVFQRRDNSSISFDRSWNDYKNGFGDIRDEHWLGNDKIHEITKTSQILNIHLEADGKKPAFGTWQRFYISDESSKYRLNVNGTGYKGTLFDDFSYHDGAYFSTKDRDNNIWSAINCAATSKGGWWYEDCGYAHPTASGRTWAKYSFSITSSVMRVTRN
ncbi:fibroleukin-like [Watersipora subatra]|uniref:fibroleukin-like n=1 Tax=Watersipora subatra TaxID=2589382 RepID=UPI00355B57ED